jgi:DNA-binding response OmpR family regulator
MKVLVVHRQEEVLRSIEAQFSKWYLKSFNNGLDGLMASRSENYDLILCGQSLPMVTGIELVRSIRNFSVNQRTPVILLADGTETKEHVRIYNLLNANLLTLEEVEEMKNLEIE